MSASMHDAQLHAARLPRMPQRQLAHIPGDYGLPVLGNTLEFLRDFRGLVNRKAAKYGPVFRSNAFFQRSVTLLGPDANEFVLRDTDHVFSSRAAWNPMLERLFTDGLMLRDFADHKFHRRMLQQAFKKNALAGYMTRMNPRIAAGIRDWPEGHTFRFFDHIKSLLLDVGAETFLGLDMGPQAQQVNQAFVDAVEASLAVLRLPIPGTTWQRGLRSRRFLEQFMTGLIPAKRAGDGDDFFSELCRAADDEGEVTLSDQDIMNHMIFLLFAAHDTTTSTLSSVIHALAQHPEWQERLAQEYFSLGTDTLAHHDLERLPQTTWVFREALRMFPPLPANTLVSVVPLHTHYMPEYWQHPKRFDPERFSPARAEDKRHFFQWVPFGGGHHKCIGLNFAELQTKLFLFHFLRRYRVSVEQGYRMPYQLVPLAVPKDGLPVQIRRRMTA